MQLTAAAVTPPAEHAARRPAWEAGAAEDDSGVRQTHCGHWFFAITTMSIHEALISLEGLSVGDAFGQQFFLLRPEFLLTRSLPPGRWSWTDDTHMALSIVENLRIHGDIHQDDLSTAFTRRFVQEPFRGYGGGAAELLRRCSRGEDWHKVAPTLFRGGSYGNGAAMRAGPIGGFFKGDPERASRQAKLSAEITHAHPEGQAGAMAVASAAAIAAGPTSFAGGDFLREVLAFVPDGITKELMERSLDIPQEDHSRAVDELGTGEQVSAQDTVPYSLWCAAYHLDSFEDAMWTTVRGLGDSDTTCAIVGGIVALCAPVPRKWVERREPLPEGFSHVP